MAPRVVCTASAGTGRRSRDLGPLRGSPLSRSAKQWNGSCWQILVPSDGNAARLRAETTMRMKQKHKVRFEPLGITVECDATETILQSALQQGLFVVDYRCAHGDCGGCNALVRSGRVQRADSRPAVGTPRGHVLLCRALAKSDVVIELLEGSLLSSLPRPAVSKSETRREVGAGMFEQLVVVAANHLSDGLMVLDEHGRLVVLNRVAARLLQCDSLPTAVEASPELQAACRAILTRTQSTPQEYTLCCAPGGRRLTAVGFPIRHDARTVAAALLFPARTLREASPLRGQTPGGGGGKYVFHNLVGRSAAFRHAIEIGRIAAGNSLSVLISGESGTGKEMLAHAIHTGSHRAAQSFIAVNCGAIPRELIESELFGYDEGAFTGARRGGRRGRFEEAHGGTLFLDEVGECSPSTQVALLRVLEQQEITRLGGSRLIQIDLRIVAATNKDLLQEVAKGQFREDLYYRLNGLSIYLPPLRDRREDIPLLAESLVADVAAALHCSQLHFSADVLRGLTLTPYPWPGNVRELRNVLQQVGVLLQQPEIRWTDFPEAIRLPHGEARPTDRPDTVGWLAQTERQLICQAVQQCAGNLSQAARQLGIARSTLYRKLAQCGLKRRQQLASG